MGSHGGVIERYELKYRLSPALVEPIRAAVTRYCDPDRAAPGGRYVISSLYLDTPELRLYRETLDQAPRRFKMRIRRYVSGPVFLEIKRRIKDVIIKTRTAVPADRWPGLIEDPAIEAALPLAPRKLDDVRRFVGLALRIRARPVAVVRYIREAYVSRADDYARVTFDYRLEGHPPDGWTVPVADGPGWIPLDEPSRYDLPRSGVILELKATTAVPLWMMDLVHHFDLRRAGFSKYACALEAVLARERPPMDWRDRVPNRRFRRRSA